jgi:hypothetical protein
MKNKVNTQLLFYFLFVIPAFSWVSCKKFVTVDAPKNALVTSSVFGNYATANAAMVGIYSKMMLSTGANIFPAGSPSVLYGLSADELNYFDGYSDWYHEFAGNNLTLTNTEVAAYWNQAYNYIYLSNAILEGLAGTSGVSDPVKKQLAGEAKFIRAFCHFYLQNSFGDIPLVTTSDYRVNRSIPRSSRSAIYQQIVSDLVDAENVLGSDFSFSNGERLRPNKWAAAALLSRIYLYTGDWQKAESESAAIISQANDFSLCNNLDSIFFQNSTESIWQLQTINPYYNYSVQDANFFIPYPQTSPFVSITSSLFQSFEPGDKRKLQWLDSTVYLGETYYFPFKYKIKSLPNSSEYYTVFRLAEQYLIRAEAKAEQNKLTESIQDINLIRSRAGLGIISSLLSQQQVLDTLAHERRIELFAEWGHRWLDLKRTGQVDQVLSAVKPGWKSTDTLYPIPQTEIQNNPQLHQNPGY